jgi:hypothetical protein
MKHLLIILISFLLLSPFLTSCEKYVGEYKDGKRNGQGTITWSDGKNYVGEFKDGKFNGHGKLTWSDGKKYVGEWKNGRPHGQGTGTLPDGRKYVGEYKDGKKWNGTVYDNDRINISKYINGVKQ